jgi:signal peptidase
MVRKIFNVFTTIVLILLVALVVFIFITRLSGNTPSIFGYHVFRVQTDSMVPTLNVGDIILVKETSAEDIHNGDIVTYRCLYGNLAGQTITHRVAQEPEVRNGQYYYVTKGDKAGAVLDDEISYDQVEGKYVKTVPYLDKMFSFFLSPAGLITFIALIVVLFGYEMISLIMSYKSIDEKDDDYYAPKNRKPKKKRK